MSDDKELVTACCGHVNMCIVYFVSGRTVHVVHVLFGFRVVSSGVTRQQL